MGAQARNAAAVERLLDLLGIEDPQGRALVAQQLAPQQTSSEPPSDADRKSWRERAHRSERLARASLGKLEVLACALGACPECWGEDAGCAYCHGRGCSGHFLPDMTCFATYVTPVLRSLTADAGRSLGPSPTSPAADGLGAGSNPLPDSLNGDHLT